VKIGTPAKPKKKSEVKGQMWVDKYKPSKFLELLSNEQSNRTVLQWLKSWDDTVFGAKNGKKPSGPTSKVTFRLLYILHFSMKFLPSLSLS
jgi:hypothetical protein